MNDTFTTHVCEQGVLDLDLPGPAASSDTGVNSGMDPIWTSSVEVEIARRSTSGEPFSAYDLADVVGEPPRPHHWGLLFQQLSARRLITCVGVAQSRRPTVHRSLAYVWRATQVGEPPGKAAGRAPQSPAAESPHQNPDPNEDNPS